MIFGQSRGEPWDGKNSGLMQGLPTGPHYLQLTGGSFLSIPGPIAAQRHIYTALTLGDKPQRACRRHDQTQRVRPKEALPLAALILAQPIEGARIPDGNFHRPAVAILVQAVLGTQRQIGGEKGVEGWGWFALSRAFG